MKTQYEDKVCILMVKIKQTEAERDKVLSNIGKIERYGIIESNVEL